MTAPARTGGGKVTRWLRAATGDGPIFALCVLFGLNLMDEIDRDGFGILLPTIQKDFHLNLKGILALVALVGIGALLLQVPIAWLADRHNRVRMAGGGGAVWGLFAIATALATNIWTLGLARIGSGIGQAVVDPTHNSLIADYYTPDVRPRVYGLHRSANALGRFLGPLAFGLIAYQFGWRAPFLVFALPTFILVLLSLRMTEPVRGAQERRAAGASAHAIATEEVAPSFAEAWRMSWKVESLRRIWYALPFLSAALLGFVSLASLLYAQQFGLDVRARGFVAAAAEPVGLVGLLLGARIATRLIAEDPSSVMRFLSKVAFVVAGLALLFAVAPWLWLAVLLQGLISGGLGLIVPGVLATLSLAIPARARSTGFSIGALWIIPGLVLLPIIGVIGDHWGIRLGMVMLTPVFLIGGWVVSSAGQVLDRDIKQLWTSSAALSEVAFERSQGRSKLLLVRGLDVSYDGVQVLFGVDIEVDEGDVIALLGTNGAGKSTLLKAISGAVQADKGAVMFDGRDMTAAPPNEIAARGVALVPGGKGVFPTLTVADNLKAASWLSHGRHAGGRDLARVLALFPVLERDLHRPAGDLSGGQQQMLALGMALIGQPRLLMIDELSLGLAPVVVEQLLAVLDQLKASGVTIILVEQSVNLALTIAKTAYFMEKGEIRFHGETAELLQRPDVLRSVFLEGAASPNGRGTSPSPAPPLSASSSPSPAPPLSASSSPSPAPPLSASSSPSPAPSPASSSLAPAVAAEPVAASIDGAASVGPPALETVSLSRSFGGVMAVMDVSLVVARGEIVGIIGPNGAGKTTLFDLVSGFVSAGSGRVLLNGTDVTQLGADPRARRGMGRSFQDARLFPALTVEGAIAVALERSLSVRDPISAALHLPNVYDCELHVRQRVAELVELLGLAAYRGKFVHELSTGTRRVVDLACLLAHRPSVVLLDEPSSGIAQRETEQLGPLLVRIRDGLGASLIVVEHDMPLVSSISDRLVAMEQGCIIAEGPPSDVLHHPEVIRSYLGTSTALTPN